MTEPRPARASGTVIPKESLISRYELKGRLGSGGMAEVYLARARGIEDFEKLVVLKRIRADKASEAKYVGMLRDEARVAAVLDHPNIVHTYDVGIDEHGVYIAMEYLHGEDVKSILDRVSAAGESVPIPLALQIVAGAAAGLHYAHERTDSNGRPLRIVHRDVSPSNILVTTHNGIKLIDFGIAKAGSRKEQTAVGTLKGKASYMSPEQVRGLPLDRRSDIFSLGIVLYELTTMERPFSADDQIAVMHKICHEPHPDPRERPGYPEPLAAIVDRALAKDPDARYANAFDMLEDLERVTRDFGLHVLPGALARYLEHVFGPKPDPWVEGVAAKAPTNPSARPMTRPTWDLAPTNERPTHEDSLTITSRSRKVKTEVVAPAPAMPPAAAGSGSSMIRGFFIGAGASLAVVAVVFAFLIPAASSSDDDRGDAEAPADASAAATLANRHGAAAPARPAAVPPSSPASVSDAALTEAAPAADPGPGAPTTTDVPAEPSPPAPPAEAPEVAADPDPASEPSAAAARSEARRNAAKAAKLAEEAGKLIVAGKHDQAEDLLRKSLKLKKTGGAYSMLTMLECKRGRAAAAASAYRRARASDRPKLAAGCAARGIDLES